MKYYVYLIFFCASEYLDGNPDGMTTATAKSLMLLMCMRASMLCACNELIAFANSISNDNDRKLKCYQAE